MSKYHTNDFVERLFVVWILILAMLYGNNAPYLLNSRESSNISIALFLVVLGSFIVIEAAYSVFIPSLRREIALRVAFAAVTLALWIPATLVAYPAKAGLILAAIIVEYILAAFMATPPAEYLLKQDHFENLDADHWVERIQDFFIIILGEDDAYVYHLSVSLSLPRARALLILLFLLFLSIFIFYFLFTCYTLSVFNQ